MRLTPTLRWNYLSHYDEVAFHMLSGPPVIRFASGWTWTHESPVSSWCPPTQPQILLWIKVLFVGKHVLGTFDLMGPTSIEIYHKGDVVGRINQNINHKGSSQQNKKHMAQIRQWFVLLDAWRELMTLLCRDGAHQHRHWILFWVRVLTGGSMSSNHSYLWVPHRSKYTIKVSLWDVKAKTKNTQPKQKIYGPRPPVIRFVKCGAWIHDSPVSRWCPPT